MLKHNEYKLCKTISNMQGKKIKEVLEQVLKKINPSKEEIEEMGEELDNFLDSLKSKIKKSKIQAEIFVGGSFAKNTLIKKEKYDADVFVRFDKKYPEKELSGLLEKVISGIKAEKVHGSRDYFRLKILNNFSIELIPVVKVNTPKEARNITDLSYSHVHYINKKIKSEKLLNEIRLAKAFFYANNCYGAESYIHGFSGYAIELLVYYFKGFAKMLNAIANSKDKIIIDIEKEYKNKNEILIDLNSAKLHSPIILLDPTYKQRNALASLSVETFEKFKKIAKEFLKSPSIKFFELKKIDFEKLQSKGADFVLLKAETNKQEGDVAGSKLIKFYNHLNKEINRFFEIKKQEFEYNNDRTANYFFRVKPKKEIIYQGPKTSDEKNLKEFKKKHKQTYSKNGRIFAKEKNLSKISEFIKKWKLNNSNKMTEMSIEELKIV